ncbi:MAG: amino acid permease [Deltaproteobacteria bacterium]|nr:amino acid permease [Deltaproteobacteria bacterium]MBW2446594.1 amino acid permease [Deltaproteobacteria bacterium]
MAAQRELARNVGLRSAYALVVANMIGAGIFTTTGFQAQALGDPSSIYLLWIVGGVLALCGALCYSELGAAMPRAGGEYVYLREAFGGAFAFMSALVSLTAGFSAPIASALESLVRYGSHFFPILGEDRRVFGALGLNDLIAVGLAWALIAVHAYRMQAGLRFNDAITAFKVVGIVAILLAAAAVGQGDVAGLLQKSETLVPEGSARFAAFATSLIFVMFCYSGWNSAAYLAGELRDPQRNLPRALLFGTGTVTVLYLGLNLLYFYGAPVDELAGKVEVGLVASRGLFGSAGVSAVTVVLTVSLLASASAMTLAGPRVYWAVGNDYPPLRFLTATRPDGTPLRSLVLQGLVTTVVILVGRVDQIMQYAGFTLSLFASLAVACVIVLRIRRPDLERPFRVRLYPLPPLLFLGVSIWMMFWAFQGRPVESSLGLLTVVVGGIAYLVTRGRG